MKENRDDIEEWIDIHIRPEFRDGYRELAGLPKRRKRFMMYEQSDVEDFQMNIVKSSHQIYNDFDEDKPFSMNEGLRLLRKIEYMARISHRSEERQTAISYDKFLRSVVLSKGDWSVVEHANLTVIFYVDRGITHEIVRHRLASYTQECVSGDTRILGNLTIKEAYDNQMINKFIRSSNGEEIVKNKISHIYDKGLQVVYEVITYGGYKIKVTKAHEFQIKSGEFTRLEYLNVGDKVMVNGRMCLLKIDDEKLKSLYFKQGYNPAEIAEIENVPYSSVTRRLRRLGLFRDYRNDKNKEKYNKNHTSESREKMIEAVKEGYRNGRKVWNKGLTEKDNDSVKIQAEALRNNHHNNGFKELNSNWKGGTRIISRGNARQSKQDIKECELCGFSQRLEVHHIDENPKNDVDENRIKICSGCHDRLHSKWKIGIIPVEDEIISIKYVGIEQTYDLEMSVHHNYVANGFIVHNSTRFVNYTKGMKPSFIYPKMEGYLETGIIFDEDWIKAIQQCEESYQRLVGKGWAPQLARSVFPNALGSRIAMTCNLRNWRHFLLMRSTREAHPQMKEVIHPLLEELQHCVPILFEDIIPDETQAENLKKMR